MLALLAALLVLQPSASPTRPVLASECAAIGDALAEHAMNRFHGSFYKLLWSFQACMDEFATRGRSGGDVAAEFRPLLNSPNPNIRWLTIQLLGRMGDRESLAPIREKLVSRDRNDVLAAINALEWLGDRTDLDRIYQLSARHWDREVRAAASRFYLSHDAQQGEYGAAPTARDSSHDYGVSQEGGLLDDYDQLIVYPDGHVRAHQSHEVCQSEQFRFRNWHASWVDRLPEPAWSGDRIAYNGEDLVSRNRGEWGGGLFRVADDGTEKMLIGENVGAALPQSDGSLLVVTGLGHLSTDYGRTYRVTGRDGALDIEPLGSLPGAPRWIADLGDEVIGIRVLSGLVIMQHGEFLGMGHCEPGAPAGPRF